MFFNPAFYKVKIYIISFDEKKFMHKMYVQENHRSALFAAIGLLILDHYGQSLDGVIVGYRDVGSITYNAYSLALLLYSPFNHTQV